MCGGLVDRDGASEHSLCMRHAPNVTRGLFTPSRLLFLFPLLVAPLAACGARAGGQTGDEFTDMSDPAGRIDENRIRVVLVGAQVHVVGEAGAVPDRASVSITEVGSGEVVRTKADAEGAFDAAVPGEVSSEFEVAVEGDSSVDPVTIANEPTGGEPTELEPDASVPNEPLSAGEAQAQFGDYLADHQSCAEDAECTSIYPDCPLGCVAYVNASFEA